MSVHFRREVDRLKKRVLSLSALVEQQVRLAVRALIEGSTLRAREVIDGDPQIDRTEVEVEEDCLKILALHQPVAVDLRFVVAVLKINNDLERIGDLAVNIAKKANPFVAQWLGQIPFDLGAMSQDVQKMLHDALDALVNLDTVLATDVCARDDAIDEMKHHMRELIEEAIKRQPQRASALLNILAASRGLERIADLTTNIAEDVIYMVEGRIIRHQNGRDADRLVASRGG
ncbi:MAG: phosphate signaling complex protein PhoU [Pirellulales bacterium]|nr:phosphate signaling complex protein PhoU [Pirellulales bacterium]